MKNSTIRQMYDRFSSIPFFWELDAWTCRATADSPYRARVIDQLGLSDHSRVLDVACGTGLNFKLLHKALGEKGLICGIDQSPKTLTLARQRVEKAGFKNIKLVETDSKAYQPNEPFDAALCTFAIEIIPPWKETIDMMVNAVKPGGRIGFIGFKLSSHKGFNAINGVFRAISVPFGGVDLDRTVREYLTQSSDEVFYQEVYGGFYYLLVAARPA